MPRSIRLGMACGLLLTAGCAASPEAVAPAAYHTLAVAMPIPAPWPKPSAKQQLVNIKRAQVGWMTAPHDDAPVHMHVKLQVFYNGKPVIIPAEIGVLGPLKMAEVHTHDDWGFIHVEGATYRPYSLGQFFDVWGVPLEGARVLDQAGNPVLDPYRAILADDQAYKVYFTTPKRHQRTLER